MALLLHLEVLVQPCIGCWDDFNFCRAPRRYPDIWTPLSKPNIFFLIGAFSGDGNLTAEAIPSEAFVTKSRITYRRWGGDFVGSSQ